MITRIISFVDSVVLGNKSKSSSAAATFLGLIIFTILTTIYYIILTDLSLIFIRSVITVVMLISFVVIERSPLSARLVSFLNPFCTVALLTVGAIVFDGDFLLYMYTLFGAMISLTYLEPKGLKAYTISIMGLQAFIMFVLRLNLLGPNFTRPQQYSGLVATFAINFMVVSFCKSYSKAIKDKRDFLSNISHEIRTPIASVIGVAELGLKQENLSEDGKAMFSRIYRSSRLLLRIINDLLDFSKLQDDKMPIINEPYDIATLISDVWHPYSHGKDGVAFKLKIDSNLSTRYDGDSERLQQILLNLLSNALKYTEKGQVLLTITAIEKGIKFELADTGVGMTPAQLGQIYNNYSRFYTSRTVGGTGLGMSIVQKLVGMMDGTIHLTSEAGVGTTATVAVPQTALGDATLGAVGAARLENFKKHVLTNITKTVTLKSENILSALTEVEALGEQPQGHVLVVDDMEINLFVATGKLTQFGVTVDTALFGQEAIDKVRAGTFYNIIFMDSMMPEMSGTQVLQALRKDGYQGPVIALTADVMAGTREDYLKAGFDEFLPKPVETDALESILRRFL